MLPILLELASYLNRGLHGSVADGVADFAHIWTSIVDSYCVSIVAIRLTERRKSPHFWPPLIDLAYPAFSAEFPFLDRVTREVFFPWRGVSIELSNPVFKDLTSDDKVLFRNPFHQCVFLETVRHISASDIRVNARDGTSTRYKRVQELGPERLVPWCHWLLVRASPSIVGRVPQRFGNLRYVREMLKPLLQQSKNQFLIGNELVDGLRWR